MKLVSKAFYSSLVLATVMGCSVATPDLIALRDESKEDVSEKPNDFAVFNPRVDILFVIDNSGSMGGPQAELARNAKIFADAMSKATILDYHIGITSTDMSACNNGMSCGQLYGLPAFVDKNTPNLVDTLSRRMVLGTSGDVIETMFAPTIAALSPNMEQGPNQGFYRKEAFLAVIFITDAADQSRYSPKDLLTFLQNKKGDPQKVLSYGVIRKLAQQSSCTTGGETLDTKLEEFLGSTANGDKRQTNVLSLCDLDYGKRLAEFANDIVKRSSNVIPLKRLPNANTIRVFYGHQEIPNAIDTGWVYVPSDNTIKLGDNIAWDTTQGYNAQLRVDFEVIEEQ